MALGLTENLKIVAFNGTGGKSLLMHVTGETPLQIDEVLVGKLTAGSGKYGKKLSVAIPDGLQQPAPGAFATLLDFKLTVKGTAGKTPYVGLAGCTTGGLNFAGAFTYTDGTTQNVTAKAPARSNPSQHRHAASGAGLRARPSSLRRVCGQTAPRHRRDPAMDATYVASAVSKGGRSGHVRSADGYIDLDVRIPQELGGPGGATNPEELFAAGYASCFLSALGLMAGKRDIDTTEATVEADVGLDAAGGFTLKVELVVRMPGVERAMAEKLVARAHEVCPYSRATRGNVDVQLTVAEPAATPG